jgi:von Willebrand factor type A domain
MSRKDDFEKLILDSYQIVFENSRKIMAANPGEKARLLQEIDEYWEHIKTFLSDYTSLCEARKLTPLDEIIDIAATRFRDIAVRLETIVASKSESVLLANLSPSTPTPIPSLKEETPLFQFTYEFVHPFISHDKDHLSQFAVSFRSNTEPSPTNLIKHICLVLDVSGSMNQSDKYPYLLQAIPHVVNSLSESDRLTIVLFSSESELVWSKDIASSRLQINDIHRKIDLSHIKFNATSLAPGLRIAIDQIKRFRSIVPAALTRMHILTDGQLHDTADCYLLNSELRQLEIEVNSFGFGNDFAEATMRQIMEGCSGGRVKWITNTDILIGEFRHIGEVAQNIVATNAELELTFGPNVIPGDAFRFEPGRYRFDPIDERTRRFQAYLGPLEKKRVYTYAFEARAFPSQMQQEQVATADLRYTIDGQKQNVTQAIFVDRSRQQEQLEQVNKRTETTFLVLEELRTKDTKTFILSLQAQLKILQEEGRHPVQIQLLEGLIAKLTRENSLSVLTEEDIRGLRSDESTVRSA